jgi:hypothetical protein
MSSCSLSLQWAYILQFTNLGEFISCIFLFLFHHRGYTQPVIHTFACACMLYFLCTRAHVGCHWTTRVYVGMTFLKVITPQKNKNKCTND